MAASKEMTLAMRIRANAAQAKAELDAISGKIRDLTHAGRSIGGGGMKLIGGAASLALKPLQLFGKAAGIAGGAIGVAGIAALRASGHYESLQLRLEAVMATAREAQQAFAETIAFANVTPFEAGDLVEARIVLEGIGIKGVKALKSTAQAAAAMGRNVGDMAGVVASLEAEPLRRLGIALKRSGDDAEFTFRDKMGRVRTIVTKDAESARKALLGIFDVKFAGATGKLGGSLFGKLSTLKDSMTAALAKLGDALMPGAKQFIDFITAEITKLSESEGMQKFVKRLKEGFSDGTASLEAAMMTVPDIVGAIKSALDAGKLGDMFAGSLVAGAQVFAMAIFESLVASKDMFIGFGKMMAGAFLEDILQLPMMGPTRAKMALDNVYAHTSEQRRQMARDIGVDSDKIIEPSHLTAAQAAKLAAWGGTDLFQSGAKQAIGGLPAAGNRWMEYAKGRMAELNDTVRGSSGVDIQERYQAHLQEVLRKQGRLLTPGEVIRPGENTGISGHGAPTRRKFMSIGGEEYRAEKYQGTVINIGNLSIRATNVQDLQREIMRRSSVPQMAVAGM